jgi:Domain of unknown function (DUF5668)
VSAEPPREPQPPAPGAPREEWREWRHQRRHLYWGGNWAWFWGVVLVIVGGYSLLRSLGLVQWIRADIFWPLLVIALGLWLIIQRAMPRQPPR